MNNAFDTLAWLLTGAGVGILLFVVVMVNWGVL